MPVSTIGETSTDYGEAPGIGIKIKVEKKDR
jgi:hypothetical protein